jgi:hypothetical protein
VAERAVPKQQSLHELARHVQHASEGARVTATRATAATSLALHVELEGHLSSLGNGILLGGASVLGIVS